MLFSSELKFGKKQKTLFLKISLTIWKRYNFALTLNKVY
jgi:hypothetical protein